MNIKTFIYKLRFNPKNFCCVECKFMNNKSEHIFGVRFYHLEVEFTASLRQIQREVFNYDFKCMSRVSYCYA